MSFEAKQTHSYHLFSFPFRWEWAIDDNEEAHFKRDYAERVDPKQLLDALDNSRDGWTYDQYNPFDEKDYNNWNYFYDYARDLIFNDKTKGKDEEKFFAAASWNFKRENCPNIYKITIKGKEFPYTLDLKSVALRIFKTGVAILTFELENTRYSDINDILNINDYGRRIYPQFLPLDATQNAFLPVQVAVGDIIETFIDYESKTKDFVLPRFIRHFLKPVFSESLKPNAAYIRPVLDDRMFVICHYKNNQFSEALKNGSWQTDQTNEDWYRFVFIDKANSLSCTNPNMRGKLIEQATYERWSEYGTLYGVSRYSFVCASDSEPFSGVITTHFKTMYRELALIWLMNRASILAFSEEAAHISRALESSDSADKINGLYGEYIRFINRFYFREVSPQEQGIELHDLGLKNMRINEQLKILDEEIEELNAYSGSKKIERLTKLGAYLLPPSLVFGFFGVNTLVWDDYVGEIVGWILTPAVIALAIASIPLTKCVIRLIEQYKRRSPKPSIKENA